MEFYSFYVQFFLIFLGIIFLVGSLFPIRSLILELPSGELKRKWKIINSFILFFISSYGGIAYILWLEQETKIIFLLIAFLLFSGGIFSFLVGKLALQMINDVRQFMLVQNESITDPLMGIKNRRFFDQKIIEEVALSKRYKLSLSIILLDLDHFKKINDIYGHKVGDEVLVNIANIILRTARDTDIVARYGGEEIAIITPNSNKQEAELLAHRLRDVIEKSVAAVIPSTNEVIQVTASMGVCAMSNMITDKDALIEEADKALYLAKAEGRNRVVCSRW